MGFRGLHLGVWAALVACASLVVMMRMLRRLVVAQAPSVAGAPGRLSQAGLVAFLAAPLLFASGTLDFAWFSGMEVALFGAVASVLLVAVDAARAAVDDERVRARRQWQAGVVGAVLVLARPEAAVVVAVATFVVARRAGDGSALAACARVALPGALATLAIAAANRLETGDAASAGAALKLLSSNPFATDEDRALDYVVDLVTLLRTMRHDLGDATGRFAYALPVLAACALTSRRTRALGALCLGGGVAFALLVSWNGAARYQSLRDYMPAVALVVFAAALGLSALAGSRVFPAGVALAALVLGLGGSHVAEGAALYTRASRNIHDQQVTVGRRLATERGRDAIVLVGDAGAIPYVSGLHAVDALGLGGYHGVPFVRAAVLGEAATLELIERLPRGSRPTCLALYPNWFPGITGTFGHETGRVTITDNVICGGVTKGIYDADWSAMRTDGDAPDESLDGPVLDELDAADVVSEERHGYVSPAPHGGWTLFDVRIAGSGARRFDAGRIVPGGVEESFEPSRRPPRAAPSSCGRTRARQRSRSPRPRASRASERRSSCRSSAEIRQGRTAGSSPARASLRRSQQAIASISASSRERCTTSTPGSWGESRDATPDLQPRTRARARGRFGCAPRWVIEPFLIEHHAPQSARGRPGCALLRARARGRVGVRISGQTLAVPARVVVPSFACAASLPPRSPPPPSRALAWPPASRARTSPPGSRSAQASRSTTRHRPARRTGTPRSRRRWASAPTRPTRGCSAASSGA